MDAGRQTISPTNKGPVLTTISWVFMVVMLLAVLTKIWNKWQRTRSLVLDDLLLALAAAVAVGQTIVVSAEASAGLGKPINDLSARQISKFAKMEYTAEILYTVVLCFTKAATSSFVMDLVPVRWVVRSMQMFVSGTVAWFFCAIVVLAFQCSMPHPWDFTQRRCIDRDVFWAFFGAFDIVTDLWLICLPVLILSVIHATKAKRAEIISVFVLRILTVPLIILRLVYLVPAYRQPGIPSPSLFPATITTEVHMHMGIVFASAPFIKAVIESMQHGMIAGELAYTTKASGEHADSVSLRNLAKPFTRSTARTAPPRDAGSQSPQRLDQAVHPYEELGPHGDATATTLSAGAGEAAAGVHRQASDAIAVKTTITTEYEEAGAPGRAV